MLLAIFPTRFPNPVPYVLCSLEHAQCVEQDHVASGYSCIRDLLRLVPNKKTHITTV